MRTRENHDARAAAAALGIGAEIGVHHSGPHPSPTSSRRQKSGRIRAEINSVRCPRSGQVKQSPGTTLDSTSTASRSGEGGDKGPGSQSLERRIRRLKRIGRDGLQVPQDPDGWGLET